MIFACSLLSACALTAATSETPGVTIRIWDIGDSMTTLHQLEPGQLPNAVMVVPTLDLAGPQDFRGFDDHFILMADGSLVISKPGTYEFELTSDDGSELWIAGTQVIDHGGLHSAEGKSGRIPLEIGTHPFQVKFFENTGDEVLALKWKPPLAHDFTVIPAEVLRTRLDPNMPSRPGRKKIVRPTLSRYPGHGSPLVAVHSGLKAHRHPVPGLDGSVTAMDWLADDRMVLLTDGGTLWLVRGMDRQTGELDLGVMAEGLDDPGGLVVADDGLWVIQREELTRLRDTTGDGRIDEYEAMATGWPVAGADRGPARGLVADGSDFLAMLGRTRDADGASVGSEHRGSVLRLSRDGSWEIIADGLVEPTGFVQDLPGNVAIIDPAATGGISMLHGRQDSPGRHGVVWPGADEGGPTSATHVSAGPWAGHVLACGGGGLHRMQLDDTGDGVQGTVFRCSQGLGDHVNAVATGPLGHTWVVGHHDDGPVIHRLEDSGHRPFEMTHVAAWANGLDVRFSHPVERVVASDPAAWHVRARDLGTGDVTRLAVEHATVRSGEESVFLSIPGLRPNTMVHVQLVGPWSSTGHGLPHSTDAWYTMHRVPRRHFSIDSSSSHRPPQANVLTPREEAEGWQLLFDGTSADHWRGFRKDTMPEGWSVIDGAIVRTGPGGDIITRDQFDDFELSLEWRVESAGNSGIFYNVDEGGNAVWATGPEMQVLDNKGHADGRSPLTSAGSNYALHPPAWDTTGPPGTWNRARIVMRGDEVEHWLNGVKIVEYVLSSPDWERRVADSKFRGMPDYGRRTRGHIALQDHGDVVAFRNLKIRPLGPVRSEQP
ncbi:MAG: DUF1080 domain-containing protein [Phycisphaerales bacterium]|nr:DUF1080 domain-containing protein [Phycisphaerales bacterium]